jgi:PAS domain S-box-containing protein
MKKSFTVLVVDDSQEDRECYLRTLKKVDETAYHCLEVQDGRKGLALADSRPLDCVLLDYSLPGLNGLEVLKTLRSRHPFLPVILLTGQGNEAVAAEAIKEGAHDYLTKSPADSERLHHAIKMAVNQAALQSSIVEIKRQIQEKTLELALSEERYELAVQGMSMGLWDWNVATGELYWSKKLKEIVGVSERNFTPRHEEFTGRLHPDDKIAVLDAVAAHCERRLPFNVEYRIRCDDGNYVWVNACGQAKWDGAGKAVRMVGSVNTIGERKKLEMEREKLIEKLTQSNADLERFAYVCSHDLQEPLRMIASFAQRLEKHLGDVLDEKGRHYMKYVTDGAVQARSMINDVLEYARVEQAADLLANVEGEAILAGVMRDLSTRIEETGARVTHDPLPAVYLQSTHLRQLLQNLIGNALKFCSQAPHVHVGVQQEGAFWRFCVRDNGIGIAPEHMPKLFSLFQRLHSRERYPGTGIGLALCKKIVQKYGGKIWVESQPGKGSSFFFTLPQAAMQQSEAA